MQNVTARKLNLQKETANIDILKNLFVKMKLPWYPEIQKYFFYYQIFLNWISGKLFSLVCLDIRVRN